MRQIAWIIALRLAAIFAGTTNGQERSPRLGIQPNYADGATGVGPEKGQASLIA